MTDVGPVTCPKCGKPGKGIYLNSDGTARVRHMSSDPERREQRKDCPFPYKRTTWCKWKVGARL